MGAMVLQGPHQEAWKSARVCVWDLRVWLSWFWEVMVVGVAGGIVGADRSVSCILVRVVMGWQLGSVFGRGDGVVVW